MDDLLNKMRDYSRFLELEDSIPYWESQIPELEDRLEEMKWNLQQKKLELLQLKEPNFFQRMFGRAEEKKEKLSKQIREITAAETVARWELEGLEKQIEAGKQELEALAGSRKMEYLYRAQDCSRRLLKILAALPEGAASPGARLENLYDYICGATSEYKQMDRLENVQEQLRTVRTQLKMLLGE